MAELFNNEIIGRYGRGLNISVVEHTEKRMQMYRIRVLNNISQWLELLPSASMMYHLMSLNPWILLRAIICTIWKYLIPIAVARAGQE